MIDCILYTILKTSHKILKNEGNSSSSHRFPGFSVPTSNASRFHGIHIYFFVFVYTMRFYQKLCKPAQLYLLISLVAYVVILVQNLTTPNRFSMGPYSREHDNQPLMLVLQLMYIALWTWLLNVICKISTNVSWLIVLFPFILYFFVFLAVIFTGKEGYQDHCSGHKNPDGCNHNSIGLCTWRENKCVNISKTK